MTEIVHHEEDSGNSLGVVMGIVLLIVAIFLLVYFLAPAIRGGGTSVNMPSGPSVNVNPR